MSTEITTLLTQAAPSPSRSLDVDSIMRRGDRVRAGRMLATIAAVPVIVAALWAGAHAGLNARIPSVPVGNPTCEWRSQELQAFVKADATVDQVIGLAAQARRLEHVEKVSWNDLFEKPARISGDLSRLMQGWGRRDFPAWLDVRLVDPVYAEDVADDLLGLPLVDEVPRGLRPAECRLDEVEEENRELRRHSQRLERENEELLDRLRRLMDELEAEARS